MDRARLRSAVGVRVLLALLFGAFVTWPAAAPATPCKGEGEACRTNRSCCSGQCVNSNPPGKRSRGSCCTADTCDDHPGKCGTFDDGCGGEIECGCEAPDFCGGGGVAGECGCTPRECEVGQCGELDDGCGGTVLCSCDSITEECLDGECVCSDPCEPDDCGTVRDKCGITVECDQGCTFCAFTCFGAVMCTPLIGETCSEACTFSRCQAACDQEELGDCTSFQCEGSSGICGRD